MYCLLSFGLGDIFGGAQPQYIGNFNNLEEAIAEAKTAAKELYLDYADEGTVPSLESIAEDEGLDLEDIDDLCEAEELLEIEVEALITFDVEEVYLENEVWKYSSTNESVVMENIAVIID